MSLRPFHPQLALTVALAALCGCTSFPRLKVQPVKPDAARMAETAPAAKRPKTLVRMLGGEGAELLPDGAVRTVSVTEATAEQIAALVPDRRIEAALPPQPLAQFVDTAFGQLLGVPYSTGPGVAERREIVALREPVGASSRSFFALVQATLRQYGLAVAIENGAVRIVQDPALAAQAPVFMRSRTSTSTPAAARPVVQFKTLKAVNVGPVSGLLEDTFPNPGVVRFAAQEDANAMVISGDAREVASASAVVDMLDRPGFAGGQVARVEPVYWPADRLAQAVADALTAEGYGVAMGLQAPRRDLLLLPVPFANAVLLFSSRPDVLARAVYWTRELDTLSATGDQQGVFTYEVRNTTATELGALVAQLESVERGSVTASVGAGSVVATATPPPGPGYVAQAPMPRPLPQPGSDPAPPGPMTSGRITVDPGGNRLLFRGSRSEFEQVRNLLIDLDTPPRQVLVEVTIAEVTLTDETRFGVDWFLETELGGGTLVLDTRGSAVKEPGGLGATFTEVFDSGRVQVALSAIAENRNLNILSTPRLVARSGSQAQILVGTDVPIITSQRAADGVQAGGDTDILQTVQYRQTGVILNMRPVVYGDDRVDIDLFQEVSSQEPNRTSAIDSPLILNRSVTSRLSLREGMTAVIGGLIQDNYSRDQRGVPLLKDIPGLGFLARSDSVSGTKVELLILVTPYILRGDQQTADATAAYAGSLNRMLRKRGPQVYTLLPWRSVFTKPVVHGGLGTTQVPHADGEAAVPVPPPQPPAPPKPTT
ncbi:secretin N-terminal domain-containing protein [Caulobacter sp. 17J65-9]|uniref:secretin N-terminal domain-containing protein n=1 Tax=Caulobacter sp. 17J65-9 TaxID=2709382 RepID=UPI0013CAD3A4|nr:secretin N-terminal domain-containing protein [Caulobacter sp. 17J65-9]NEX94876.1 hypothetical protein [Caulobacter sp. 17J65-9]